MSVDAAKEGFFKADHFAVAGASKDPSKIGNKVMKWYKAHGFEPIPIHPKEASIEGASTISSVFDIYEPKTTSVSIITPPHVSINIVKTALLELDVAGIWLQPGAENAEIQQYIDTMPDELKNRVVLGGPCILVEGAALAKAQGKL
ncbi:NAD(P)-binding protein [Ceraceosorus guamensis]|uniref:NAD(P)-binding protein n=1 Tax=Ceraceosorus guamensis TaxID=1522189 RepID=A0A316VXU8_9BASI|nr:NAD(P)-binding protein [Ceraceosorus guamensis]PWN42144.1 NAD(P)-binding protein [Ceraceosorus guamensis]